LTICSSVAVSWISLLATFFLPHPCLPFSF
jgi:hypothetical protein